MEIQTITFILKFNRMCCLQLTYIQLQIFVQWIQLSAAISYNIKVNLPIKLKVL